MAGIFEINKWMLNAISETQNDGITRDIHIRDANIPKVNKKNINKLNILYSIFEDLVVIINETNTDGIGVYMSIELISNSKLLQGLPNNTSELEDLINEDWIFSEIIVYKPFKHELISLVEFYRTPIFLSNSNKNINVFYKEFRTQEEKLLDSFFTREINICYCP